MLARISSTWRHSLRPISLSVRVASPPGEQRIPLASDNWLALLNAIRTTGDLVIQTRHRHARLIANGPLPDLAWDAPRRVAYDQTGRFQFHTAHWAGAVGWVRHCPCCGSPGGVAIHDHTGAECLQFCAPVGASLSRWEHLLGEWRAPTPPVPVAPAGEPADALRNLQQLPPPPTALPMEGDLDALANLLHAAINRGLRLACTLETTGARHRQEFLPRKLDLSNRLLVLSGGGGMAQVILPAVGCLAADHAVSASELHMVGSGGGSLLAIGPEASAAAARCWRGLLRAAFRSSC